MTASLATGLFRHRGPAPELWSAAGVLVLGALCALVLLLSPFSTAAQAQAVTLITIGVPLITGLLAIVAGLRSRESDGPGWTILGAGAVVWAIGHALRASSGLPIALDPLALTNRDLLQLASLPLVASGVLAMLARPSTSATPGTRWLDAAVVVAGLIAMTWFFILAPLRGLEGTDRADLLLRVALPVGGIAAVAALIIDAARRTHGQPALDRRTLLIGVACLGLSHLLASWTALRGFAALEPVCSLGWCLGFLLVGHAALMRVARPVVSDAAGDTTALSALPRLPDVAWLYASAALVLTLGILIWRSQANLLGPSERRFLAFALVTGALFVARQVAQARAHSRLAGSFGVLSSDIEEAVTRRTQEMQRFVSIFDSTPDVVAATDVSGRVLYVNEGGRRLLGIGPHEDVSGRSLNDLHPAWAARLIVDRGIPAALETGTWQGETAFLNAQGDEVPVSHVMVAHRDAAGDMEFLSVIAREITTQKAYESHLLHLSSHDALTGVFNRAFIIEKLSLELEWGRPVALAYLDLDNFKLINDAIGHGAGDELLMAVASTITATVRDDDIVARLGGDEFALLFPNSSEEGALRVVERVLAAIRERAFVIAGRPVRITASAGIALAPQHGRDSTDLLAHADMAMYRAKVDRDSSCLYTPDKDSQVSLEHDRVIEIDIRDALIEDRFRLFAQLVSPFDDDPHGEFGKQFEVLLRLQSRDGEILPPNQFLPVAERSALIVEIDRWVCRKTIDFVIHCGLPIPPVVHINLSGKAIGDQQLIFELRESLNTHAFDPSRIVFEITETAAVTNLGAASQFIQTLKSLGFRFGLDDFGVGYSSISHLKNLDVDYLKIDGSFITNLTHDVRDQHLVRAIVELAKALGKTTVAEYVGDEETVEALRALGVDFGQGFHLGRPGPIADVVGVTTPAAPISPWLGSAPRRPLL